MLVPDVQMQEHQIPRIYAYFGRGVVPFLGNDPPPERLLTASHTQVHGWASSTAAGSMSPIHKFTYGRSQRRPFSISSRTRYGLLKCVYVSGCATTVGPKRPVSIENSGTCILFFWTSFSDIGILDTTVLHVVGSRDLASCNTAAPLSFSRAEEEKLLTNCQSRGVQEHGGLENSRRHFFPFSL